MEFWRFLQLVLFRASLITSIIFLINNLDLFHLLTRGNKLILICFIHKVNFRFPPLIKLLGGFCRSFSVDYHAARGFPFGWELNEKSEFEVWCSFILLLDPVATVRVRLIALHIRHVHVKTVTMMYGTMRLVEKCSWAISGDSWMFLLKTCSVACLILFAWLAFEFGVSRCFCPIALRHCINKTLRFTYWTQ